MYSISSKIVYYNRSSVYIIYTMKKVFYFHFVNLFTKFRAKRKLLRRPAPIHTAIPGRVLFAPKEIDNAWTIKHIIKVIRTVSSIVRVTTYGGDSFI